MTLLENAIDADAQSRRNFLVQHRAEYGNHRVRPDDFQIREGIVNQSGDVLLPSPSAHCGSCRNLLSRGSMRSFVCDLQCYNAINFN